MLDVGRHSTVGRMAAEVDPVAVSVDHLSGWPRRSAWLSRCGTRPRSSSLVWAAR